MLNIAVCDDMPVLREMLVVIIQQYEKEKDAKFNIYQFGSGEDFLEEFDKDNRFFDLIFFDNYMKKLTGVDTALHIRKYNAECDIVFVTSSDTAYEFIKVSPLKILRKPAAIEEVYKIINKVLSKKAAKQTMQRAYLPL